MILLIKVFWKLIKAVARLQHLCQLMFRPTLLFNEFIYFICFAPIACSSCIDWIDQLLSLNLTTKPLSNPVSEPTVIWRQITTNTIITSHCFKNLSISLRRLRSWTSFAYESLHRIVNEIKFRPKISQTIVWVASNLYGNCGSIKHHPLDHSDWLSVQKCHM